MATMAGHVVNHGEAAVVGDQVQRHQRAVDHPLRLEQHDPGGRSHQQKQEVRPAWRGMGNQIGDRIAEEQAQYGQAQAHDQGAPQEG